MVYKSIVRVSRKKGIKLECKQVHLPKHIGKNKEIINEKNEENIYF
jgi:nitrate/TMAO reductase-like tetraheme cytochrome c subunit